MADMVVSLAQVKGRLEITDANDDALITELVEELTDWIHDITGRHLVPEPAATYTFDTGPGSVIEIPRGIRAVTSLGYALSDQPDTGGVYTAVALADVLIRPLAVDRKPGWPGTRVLIRSVTGVLGSVLNGARIVGDYGFAAAPPTIQAVALDAVVTAYTSHRGGASDVIGADGSVVFPWAKYFSDGTPQLATIHRYRGPAGIG